MQCTCCVCYREVIQGVQCFKCRQVYDVACFDEWMRRCPSKTCPTCRTVLHYDSRRSEELFEGAIDFPVIFRVFDQDMPWIQHNGVCARRVRDLRTDAGGQDDAVAVDEERDEDETDDEEGEEGDVVFLRHEVHGVREVIDLTLDP